MAIKFYTLKVSDLIRETKDTVSISFEITNDLKDIFNYKAGQYITIKVPVNGEENRRAYSISSSPHDNILTISVKKVDDGKVSNYINSELKVGDLIELMPPLGNFVVDCDINKQNNYVLIGGGSGITPLMSIIKTVLNQEPKSKLSLVYQNRDEETIIFKNELEKLQSNYPERLSIIHFLSKPKTDYTLNIGRIDSIKLLNLIKEITGDNLFRTEFYICGPQGLMNESELALKNLLIASHKIHKESFTSSVAGLKEDRNDIVMENSEELKDRKVKIILYGDELEMIVSPDETILTAGQREGYDPPYSCQIGACSTCRAKLISGKVVMDERDSLTDEEIEEGYVLTCQAHPLTDDVIIDFDDN